MPPANQQPGNKFEISNGLATWLRDQKTSIVFSSYDSGFLFFLGEKDGTASLSFRKYGRAMGLCYVDETLFLASNDRIFELENIGRDGEEFDALFIPRRSTFIGNCDCHEITVCRAIDFTGTKLLFSNTAYSCVATLNKKHSFSVYFSPGFITKTVPEDRCHLNGLCVRDGELSLVSYINRSDVLNGWRSNRGNGGTVLNIITSEQITGLSMPHSPRWYGEKIAYLDSGRGFLVIGEQRIFCPGFLRGLCFKNKYAIVTVSLPRHGIFSGLELQENLKRRGGEAWCGILIINLETEAIEHWLRIEGEARELFDCCLLPNIKCPSAIAIGDPSLLNRTTFI